MSEDFHTLRFEYREDGVVVLTLARPPVNALGRDLIRELHQAADSLGGNAAVRAVVVAAEGKAFCAGADLRERKGMSEEQVVENLARQREALGAVAAIPVPTIAAIHAAAAGGGCELALACDLRVMAEGAKIGVPECGLAIIPGAGATQRLPRLIGPALAKKWIFSARLFTAAEALADGVVQAVAPRDKVLDEALTRAAEIAACGPVAIRAAKRAVDRGLEARTLAEGLEVEWSCYQEVLPTEDRREALEAFARKRKPVYKGR